MLNLCLELRLFAGKFELLDDDTMVLIRNAATALKRGELVVFPTETVYGLGADAKNPEAVRKVFAAKGRPADHPVIVHLAEFEQLAEWCRELPPSAELLADLFWPGPLTLVLRKAAHVLAEVTGGQDTVAVRIPSHPIAHALLKEFGSGVVAPSANKFGRLSPTTAADVLEDFTEGFAMVLDGGPCEIGIESTIVDLTSSVPRILRPGMVLEESILVALNSTAERSAEAARERVSLEGVSLEGVFPERTSALFTLTTNTGSTQALPVRDEASLLSGFASEASPLAGSAQNAGSAVRTGTEQQSEQQSEFTQHSVSVPHDERPRQAVPVHDNSNAGTAAESPQADNTLCDAVNRESIGDSACLDPEVQCDAAIPAPRVPGSLQSHYAPRTKVRLVNSADINKLIDEFESQGYATAVLSFKPPAMLHRHWITAKSFPSHYAHTLYRNLRKLDAANADIIIVEEPPLNSDWVGIWDRIRRAASETGPTKSMDSEKENGDGA